MSLIYADGFETCADDSDLRARGWVATSAPIKAAFVPSFTNVAGTSLTYLGAPSPSNTIPGIAGAPDIGYYNTNVTVNHAWQSGGFTYGFGGYINQSSQTTLGYNSSGGYPAQIAFDGTNYWTIGYNSSTRVLSVMYSSNLTSWTITATQPTSLGNYDGIFYVGNGTIAVTRNISQQVGAYYGGTSSTTMYYTTNNGSSWTTSLAPAYSFNGGQNGTIQTSYMSGLATGNTTYPYLFFVSSTSTFANASAGNLYIGTGMSAASFTSLAITTGNGAPMVPRIINGNIFVGSSNSVYWCPANSSSLNTLSSWTNITVPANIQDINYFATTNLWVAATSAGIYTTPNTGVAGNAIPPSANATWTQRYNTNTIRVHVATGTNCVAFDNRGYVVTSPDGINWTTNYHLIYSGAWLNSIWDGSKLVCISDYTNGIVATTTDGFINWNAVYSSMNLDVALTSYTGTMGVYTGSAPTSTGTFTANSNFFGMLTTWTSSSSRTFSIATAASTSLPQTYLMASNPGYHYFELTAIPAATANNFYLELAIDGTMVISSGTTATLLGSSTSDTSSLLILSLGRDARIVGLDDIYFTVNDGNGVTGPLGPINMVARRPNIDVNDMWNKQGTASTNSLSVNQKALSSNANNYIQSMNTGDKDVYKSNDTLPTGFKPIAVVAEAFYAKASNTAPTVSLGVISNNVESDSSPLYVSQSGNIYLSQVLQSDPNGNVPWTNASVTALNFTTNHNN